MCNMHSLSSFIVKYVVQRCVVFFSLLSSVCCFIPSAAVRCTPQICNYIWDATHKYTSLHCWYLYDTNMTYSFFVLPSLCLKISPDPILFRHFVHPMLLPVFHSLALTISLTSCALLLERVSVFAIFWTLHFASYPYCIRIFGAWTKKHTKTALKEWRESNNFYSMLHKTGKHNTMARNLNSTTSNKYIMFRFVSVHTHTHTNS